MRLLLTIACISTALIAHSQDCGPGVLMKEGTRLEYQSYIPKTNLLGKLKGYHKSARLIFTVNVVKDSGSNTVSYITKEGISFKNPKRDTYKKEIVLACNEKLLRIPFDLFNPDTSFLADIYPAAKRAGFYTAHASLDRPAYLFIPHALENARELNIDKSTSNFQLTIHDYMPEEFVSNTRRAAPTPNNTSSNFGQRVALGKLEEKLEVTIRKVTVEGKENITTPAGSFDCYKIVLHANMHVMKRSHQVNYNLYYDPAIGCIKFEVDGPMTGGYIELINMNR